MTININLTITLDASDLIALRANLAAITSGVRLFTETPEATQIHTEQPPSPPSVAPSVASVNHASTTTANGLSLPKPQNGPKRSEKPARPPKIAAPPRTPVLPPIPAATVGGEPQRREEREEKPNGMVSLASSAPGRLPDSGDPPHPSSRLPFAEFDRLVRKEMKRLAMDGRLPGHKLWDNERTQPLPTLAAVILRYRADGLVGLAEMLGFEPPLSVQKKEEPTP